MIKQRISNFLAEAITIAGGGAFDLFVKPMRLPKEKKQPKTLQDYKAMNAAELKRRRKAAKRALQSNTI